MVAPPNAVAPPDAVAPPAHAGSSSRPLVAFVVIAVLVVALVLGLVALNRRGSSGGTASGSSSSSSASAVALPGTISSVDPSEGSGFRRDGSSWRTQTYTSADFGNLKDGVGLLLDLGSARTVTSVTFDVVGGPIAVELRAGDTSGRSPSSYDRVVADPSASGSTTLAVKGGAKHRYWLVWVTKLAAQDGGYRAILSTLQARGPRS
jgi:putative peptidoglycan lipid II flippase